MNLRTEILRWLAEMPALQDPAGRGVLLEAAGPAGLYLDLSGDDDPYAFMDRLLEALAREGRGAFLAFLAALHPLPWLQANARCQRELAELQSRLETLAEEEFASCFLGYSGREMAESVGEWPDESEPYSVPATGGAEPPTAGEMPGGGGTAGATAPVPPAPPPPAPAPAPRRPLESMPPAASGGVIYEGDVDVGRDLIGRDQVVHGDQVAGAKYEAATINIYQGPQPAALDSPLIEEAIRLDVAAPAAATLEVPFDLAVAVRQPEAPTLAIEDLTQVKSQDGAVFRREEEEIVLYRVGVIAASCDVQPTHHVLKLRPRTNSAPCWFQLTPHRPGKQSVIVTAYQQDDAIAAQTRLSIEIQVPVSPGT